MSIIPLMNKWIKKYITNELNNQKSTSLNRWINDNSQKNLLISAKYLYAHYKDQIGTQEAKLSTG